MRGGYSYKLDVLAALPGPEIAKVTRRGTIGTVQRLAEQVGIDPVNVRKHLRRLHAEELAHIGCWNRVPGNLVPVWVKGKGQHAPRPKRLSAVATSRRYRARVKKAIERSQRGFQYDERYTKYVVKARGKGVTQHIKVAPQQWFSALGL